LHIQVRRGSLSRWTVLTQPTPWRTICVVTDSSSDPFLVFTQSVYVPAGQSPFRPPQQSGHVSRAGAILLTIWRVAGLGLPGIRIPVDRPCPRLPRALCSPDRRGNFLGRFTKYQTFPSCPAPASQRYLPQTRLVHDHIMHNHALHAHDLCVVRHVIMFSFVSPQIFAYFKTVPGTSG